MPRPAISPLHERLRRTALGLDKRNLPHHQLRALAELDRLERPRWRRKSEQPSAERVAWYARTLAEVYVAGSGDLLRGRFLNRRVADSAWHSLTTLTDPVAHEAVRQVWLEDPAGKLRDLIKDWLPTEPAPRAVTLFLLGDFNRYAAADPSGALLEAARAEGSPALRVQLALAAQRGNRLDWAYRVTAAPERLLPEEWEAAIELLREGDRQEYLWKVIDRAPLKWSARCLTELDGWRPTAEPDRKPLVLLAKKYARRSRSAQPFELLARLDGQEKVWHPGQLLVTPDGSTLISLASSTVHLLSFPAEPSTGPDATLVMAATPHGGQIGVVSPDGSLLATARDRLFPDATVRLWRLPSGAPAGVLRARGHWPAPVIFAPDGTGLLSLGGGRARFWRLPNADEPSADGPAAQRLPRIERLFATRRPVDRYSVPNAKVVFSPDGTLVAIGRRGKVRLRRWPEGSSLGYVPVKDLQPVRGLEIVPTGDLALISGWNPSSGHVTLVARLPTGQALAFPTGNSLTPPLHTPDGNYLVLVRASGPALYRLPACTPVRTQYSSKSLESTRPSAAITSDSRLLVTSDDAGTQVWELPSGRRLGTVELTHAQLLPTAEGALLVGYDRKGAPAVLRYRPSRLTELAERPIGELTPAETECFHDRYDDPADAALAELGAALLTRLRRDRPRGP